MVTEDGRSMGYFWLLLLALGVAARPRLRIEKSAIQPTRKSALRGYCPDTPFRTGPRRAVYFDRGMQECQLAGKITHQFASENHPPLR